MPIEEILEKPVNKWKWKECDELINNPDVDPSTKEEAKQRKSDIKAWLDKKDKGEQKVKETVQKLQKASRFHLAKIDVELEELTKASDQLNLWLNQQAATIYYITEFLDKHDIDNPQLAGMLYNQFKEDTRFKAGQNE